MDDDKIKAEDLNDEKNPVVESDPEVLAEVKKNRLLHLKLERWKETAKAVGVVLQTFKAEAVSLVSGLGTLVLGWFQLKKWVLTGRKEVVVLKTENEVVASVPKPKAKPRQRPETNEYVADAGHGYGSGHGRTGSSQQQVASSPARKPKPTKTPESFEKELVEVEAVVGSEATKIETMFTDTNTYVWFGLIVAFAISSFKAWIKKKRKALEEKGGSNV